MNMGNSSNVPIPGQPYQSSTAIPLPSRSPSPVPATIAAPIPIATSVPLSTSTPLMPLLDAHESSNSNRVTNLVKPSTFFGPPSSSTLIMPPVSSSVPTAPPLHPHGNVQRPYGAPLLQPFPPPTPPPFVTPSSTPATNYGPVISREKVRDALLVLVQVCLLFHIHICTCMHIY